MKSYQWTDDFIHRWKDKVVGKSTISTAKLASAQNAFLHEKYEKIIPLTRGMDFENSMQKIAALGLELIVLFQERKENYLLLRNFISNFKRTLKRSKDKISVNQYKSHANLIKVIELLIKKDFTKTTIHLDKYDHLIFRRWVEKQINKAPQN